MNPIQKIKAKRDNTNLEIKTLLNLQEENTSHDPYLLTSLKEKRQECSLLEWVLEELEPIKTESPKV